MIKILITGDFCTSHYKGRWPEQGEFDEIYSDFRPLLEGNDLNITNLECPLYNGDSPIQKSGSILKASTRTIYALKYGNFNLVTLANNHIMDHGHEGLISTIHTCNDFGINTVGAGMNFEEASKPYYITIQNKIIAIVNIAENEFSTTTQSKPGANGLNPIANFYDITVAKKKAHYVFVVIHGGREHYINPTPRVQETYRFFVNAGADAVIGHHTHCFQGYEIYKNAPIFYSLGNFIFPPSTKNYPKTWYSGYAVKFIINDNSLKFEIIAYKQGIEGIGIRLLNFEEIKEFNTKIGEMNKIILNRELLLNEFEEYCKTQVATYKTCFEPYNGRYTKFLFNKGLLPSLINRHKKLQLYDIINCEAHREIILRILKP